MKIFLIVLACVVALLAVGGGALVYWGANQKVDMADPNVAAGFKKSFLKSCVDGVETRLAAAGKTATAEQHAQFTALCGCMSDDTLARMSAQGDFKLADLATHSEEFAKQMQQSGETCTAKLGLQGN